MSRETVVCTASWPASCSASASSAWVEIWRSRIRRRIARLALAAVVRSRREPPGGSRSRWATSSAETVSGGVRRRCVGPAEVTSRPRRGSRRRPRRRARGLEAEQQAGAAHRQRLGELGAPLADVRQQLVVDASRRRRSAAAQTTGLPPNVEAWSPGSNRVGGVVGDEQRADRQAVGEPLRERGQVRPHAELLEGEERPRPADAGLHLVEAEERAVLGGELGGGGEEAGRRRVARRPRPGPARSGSGRCPGRRRPRARRRR